MRLRRGSLSQSREKNNLWHPGYLLLCYRLKFRVAYFTVKTDVTRKCCCVTNTRKKCSASKYRPSENTTTVLFTRKQCQTFYFFDILIGYRDAEFRSAFHLYGKISRSGGTTNGTVPPTGNFSEKKE